MNSETRAAPRAVIVYESMFGNTRRIAEAIADGVGSVVPSLLVPIAEVSRIPAELDLLIVGGPTHAHGLSRPESRREAVTWASTDRLDLELDETWQETGIREWLRDAPPPPCRFASFDTRVDMPRLFTGSAATTIARKLDKLGFDRLSEPASFLVDHRSRLEPGEVERARAWGADLAGLLTASTWREGSAEA